MTLSQLHAVLDNMIADYPERYDFPIVIGTSDSLVEVERIDARAGIVIVVAGRPLVQIVETAAPE